MLQPNMPTVDDKISFERRLQSIVQACILAAVVGIGATLFGLVKDVTTLTAENKQMQRELIDLKADLSSVRTQITSAAISAANAATAAAVAAAAAAAKK